MNTSSKHLMALVLSQLETHLRKESSQEFAMICYHTIHIEPTILTTCGVVALSLDLLIL